MTSVTTGSPVSRLASARYLSPSSSSPWNEYGDVRGLNAPPLKTRAPAALTFAATSNTCSRDSTEHGPAITTISVPPIPTPSTEMTVASTRKKRRPRGGPRPRVVGAAGVRSARGSLCVLAQSAWADLGEVEKVEEAKPPRPSAHCGRYFTGHAAGPSSLFLGLVLARPRPVEARSE